MTSPDNIHLNEFADEGAPAIVRICNFLRRVGAATHTEITGACAVEWHKGHDALQELIKQGQISRDETSKPYAYLWQGE